MLAPPLRRRREFERASSAQARDQADYETFINDTIHSTVWACAAAQAAGLRGNGPRSVFLATDAAGLCVAGRAGVCRAARDDAAASSPR